jgi:hypothetical protein
MKLRTCTVSLVTLSAAVLLGTAAFAGDLPKEGKFTATYSSAGTFKGSPIGKEALFSNFDENGLSLGDGLFDHLSWHCFGLYEVLKGMAQFRGHCIATDPAGDQLASDFVSDGTFPADAKNPRGTGTFRAGTGKYAGISGGWTFVTHSPEFKTAADGTYVQHGTNEGSYKLP